MPEIHDTASLREQFLRTVYRNGATLIRFITVMGMFWGLFGSIYGAYWMIEGIYTYYNK
jgi:hypothetical protein